MARVDESQMTSDEKAAETAAPAKNRGKGRYAIRTLGCQMNVADSERIAGVLETDGYTPASGEQVKAGDVDLVVLNTCAVRQNATERMYGTLGSWHRFKLRNPEAQIAVGGCMAQKDRDAILKRDPWVDAVFGTHTIDALPQLLDKARATKKPQIKITRELKGFPSDLPAVRGHRASAWVSISMGCNNTCTFCIVPSVRGRERDRPETDVLAEIRSVVAAGAKEITLLGQNVNSYGYSEGDRYAFSRLLRDCGRIEGLERVRFTSPHPAAFTDDVIETMAQTPNIMHQLHMPLQSGSDKTLRAMRRSYRTKRFLAILDKVRAAMPDARISTDIIVGFPGETEEDFQQTVDIVKRARFTSAYIFEYSPRPDTPAASMQQVPHDIVSDRFNRLQTTQERITREEMAKLVGTTVEMMIAAAPGRKDQATHRVTGREKGGLLVHAAIPEGQPTPQVGQFVLCTVTQAGPHYLVSDPSQADALADPTAFEYRAAARPQGLYA